MATRRKQQHPFPLEDDQVFGVRTVNEGTIIWKHPGVATLNAALDVPGDVFDDRTRTAVVRKQKAARSLDVTGVVDEKTWDAIVP